MTDPAMCRWITANGLPIKASYRVDELARLLGRSRSASYDIIRRRGLPVVRTTTTEGARRGVRIPMASLAVLFNEGDPVTVE